MLTTKTAALCALIVCLCAGFPAGLSQTQADGTPCALARINLTLEHPWLLARCSTTQFQRADLQEAILIPGIDTGAITSLRVKTRASA